MKWDERCSALRRDGQPCRAPAIKGGFVCRIHGGSTQQAQFAAERRRLQMAILDAIEAWHAAKETPHALDQLAAVATAERNLERYETKLAELAQLRARLKRLRAAQRRPASSDRDGVNGRSGEQDTARPASPSVVDQLTRPAVRASATCGRRGAPGFAEAATSALGVTHGVPSPRQGLRVSGWLAGEFAFYVGVDLCCGDAHNLRRESHGPDLLGGHQPCERRSANGHFLGRLGDPQQPVRTAVHLASGATQLVRHVAHKFHRLEDAQVRGLAPLWHDLGDVDCPDEFPPLS